MSRSPDHPAPSSPGQDPRPTASEGRRPTHFLRMVVSSALLVVTVGGLISWWIWSRLHVRTNNAYVVGNITPVSSQISGMVVALYTDDNMIVKAGDPLAQIDPVPWQLAVDQALADLAQLRAQERAAEIGVRLIRQERKAFLDGA
jgi:membrane fusion protein, multidrug efflux system